MRHRLEHRYVEPPALPALGALRKQTAGNEIGRHEINRARWMRQQAHQLREQVILFLGLAERLGWVVTYQRDAAPFGARRTIPNETV